MYRTQLLNDLVSIDAKFVETTGLAAHAQSDRAFEAIISELRVLRAKRSEIMAKLDEDRDPPAANPS